MRLCRKPSIQNSTKPQSVEDNDNSKALRDDSGRVLGPGLLVSREVIMAENFLERFLHPSNPHFHLRKAIQTNNIRDVKLLAPACENIYHYICQFDSVRREGIPDAWRTAISLGRTELVCWLAASDTKIRSSGLFVCIQCHNLDTLDALIGGKDLSQPTPDSGVSLLTEVLLYAIEHKALNIFTHYLKFAATISVNEEFSKSSADYFWMITRGEVEIRPGSTLLHRAVIGGPVEVVKNLVDAGANLHHVDSNGCDVLKTVAEYGSKETLGFFLSCGAHVQTSVREQDRCTDLDKALKSGNVPAAKMLMIQHPVATTDAKSAYNRILHQAFLDGDLAFVQTLRDHGWQLQDASFERAMHLLRHPDRKSLLNSLRTQIPSFSDPEPADKSVFAEELAVQWFHRCLSTHGLCMIEEEVPSLPSRILEIRDSWCRLIRTDNQKGHYATLSHRWHVENMYKTTTSNLEEHQNLVESSRLSHPIQTAIHFARTLGLKYLWIDALCIVQDSESELSKEISKMADIYGKSCLTIAIIDTWPPSSEQNNIAASRPAVRPRGMLDTRAWVLQEQVLSRRVLNCTKDGLYWDCITHHASPAHDTGIPQKLDRDFRDRDLRILKEGIHLGRLITVNAAVNDYLQSAWHRIVEDYSRRKLTKRTDRALAIAGIASKMSHITGHTYFAGVWQEFILQDLCWMKDEMFDRPVSPALQGYKAHFPSWSWLSAHFPIRYYFQDRSMGQWAWASIQIRRYIVSIESDPWLDSTGKPRTRLRLRGVLQDLRNGFKEIKSQYKATAYESHGYMKRVQISSYCHYDTDETPSDNCKYFWAPGMSLSLIIEPTGSPPTSEQDTIIKYRRIGVLLNAYGSAHRNHSDLKSCIPSAHDDTNIIDLV